MHAAQFLRVRILQRSGGNCSVDCGPKDGRFIAPLMHGNLPLHNFYFLPLRFPFPSPMSTIMSICTIAIGGQKNYGQVSILTFVIWFPPKGRMELFPRSPMESFY
jgi:hypothetical protein